MTEMIQGDFWAPFFCLYIPSQIDYYVQLTLGKVWWIVVCISSVAVTSSSSSRVNIGVPHNPYYWYVISISIRGLSRSSCHHPSLHSFLIYSLPFPAFLINSLPSVPFPSLLMLSLLISLNTLRFIRYSFCLDEFDGYDSDRLIPVNPICYACLAAYYSLLRLPLKCRKALRLTYRWVEMITGGVMQCGVMWCGVVCVV